MKGARALRGAVVASWLATACYPTTIRSGQPALPSSERSYWHHAFVFGLVEASGPYRLNEICPGGWSEFYADMSSFQGILRVVTLGLYAPARVRIVCAAPPNVDVNSVSEGPLPELRLGGPPRPNPAPIDAAPDAGAPLPDADASTR